MLTCIPAKDLKLDVNNFRETKRRNEKIKRIPRKFDDVGKMLREQFYVALPEKI